MATAPTADIDLAAGLTPSASRIGGRAARRGNAHLPGDPCPTRRQPDDGPRPAPPDADLNAAYALRNLRMMRLLERIAEKFNEADVPLLVLKGAALNLTVYDRPDARYMEDLDLLVRPQDVDRARVVLEELGGLRGESNVREDFFPRFHYETEYKFGAIYPVKVDLHVRPFRPFRYAATVPADALWERAQRVPLGRASVLIPSAEDMLIHLAVHAAVHGPPRPKWIEDMRLWVNAYGTEIDWDYVVNTTVVWKVALAFRTAIRSVEQQCGPICPQTVTDALARVRVGWCDRLVLRQAPRDADHPASHILVNVLCTPDRSLAASYLRAVCLPSREYMSDRYRRRHWGWLWCAHLLRWLSPLAARLPWSPQPEGRDR